MGAVSVGPKTKQQSRLLEPMDINAHTQFCGVIGNPVEHSLSPAIHNAAFQKLGLNFVYLAFRVEAIGDAIKGLRALGNFRGASVTIPHKVAAVPFLDSVEPTARHIGAINTIVAEGGTLTGYNTDATGALRALREGGVTLKGQRVVMLGSGGAARAIAFALGTEAGIDRLTILGIDDQERTALARDLQSKTGMTVQESPLDERYVAKGSAGYSCADPLHTDGHVAQSTRDLCAGDVAPCGTDGHGYRLQPSGHPVAEGCEGGRLSYDSRARDVSSSSRGAVRALDQSGCSSRRHARRTGIPLLMNIVLIGYRGTGKSTVGRLLAARLGRELVSTDAEIVKRAQRTIPEIVAQEGWEYFRDLESDICRELAGRDQLVIDTGGGAILREQNVEALKKNGTVFWLTASVETIAKRIGGDNQRPSLTGTKSFVDEIQDVLRERTPKYQAAADHVIATDDRSINQLVETLLTLV